MQMEKTLMNQKLMQMPAIFIQPDVDKTLTSKLKDIIKRHQGTIVDSEDDASHIIYALPTNQPPEGQFWLCLEREGGFSFSVSVILPNVMSPCTVPLPALDNVFTGEITDVKIIVCTVSVSHFVCLLFVSLSVCASVSVSPSFCLTVSVFEHCFCVCFCVFLSLLHYSILSGCFILCLSVSMCPSFLIPSCPDWF